MRRLYVRREERGKGIGRKLIQHILEFAAHYYSRFEVRCDTTAANQFYCALGFSRTAAKPGITHQIDLREAPNQSNTP
jgi:ribosomal protein S18 acetylase RimI-like enzyme